MKLESLYNIICWKKITSIRNKKMKRDWIESKKERLEIRISVSW